ncbi:MAG TPA: OmpA family protein [Saprospiraceae bacterium]|jgi:outer membrane protein OmpA-like peptidoglycan-associated protein|nr:OmpA family protein [Candidatus Parvibacillus calidus]MBX2937344.1 OmpA family protein [Saprospiraceae bacterium]MCB0590061.1 OmpA family protein [Saprospiraceae bacterium]MCC7149073.1 OmpA family protein [Saprospiraceae bacterium]MCO5284029.1 OmpA family protein [Saprospiraceae bacterium]
MTKKFNLVVLLLAFFGVYTHVDAQSESFKSPVITDEMTVNPDQNREWRAGQSKYSAKPKNMWEVGVHVGRFSISGDIPTTLFPGWGAGIHLRKAINYALSVRVNAMYGTTKGFDDRFSSASIISLEQLPNVGSITNGMYRNYKNTTITGSIEGVLNIGNILFHKERNKWNLYTAVGVGFASIDTRVNNVKNGAIINWESLNLDPNASYADNVKKLKDAMDSDYETKVGNNRDVSGLFDNGKNALTIPFTVGVSRKLTKRVNLSLEHTYYWADYDAWDGFVYRSAFDQSNDSDNGQYTSLRLGINLGSFDKRTEPLYWLNPLDGALNDVAELKQRPKFDLTDSDGDGVIDMLDQEKNSPSGAAVDTRGVTLDSDKDGIPDYKDDEPYSPPGYEVDSRGVAVIPDKPVTESKLNEILKNTKTDWWLPMIHFDLDKYFVKPEFYPQLQSVASVMKSHPDIKIAVTGYTDVRMGDDYNRVLSYNRAKAAIDYLVGTYNLPRERFVLQYDGKADPIIPDLPASHNITKKQEMQQYINRRVEFRVATAEDAEMAAPTGPKAGADTPGSSRKGSKYSGNSNSGY